MYNFIIQLTFLILIIELNFIINQKNDYIIYLLLAMINIQILKLIS